MRAKKREIFSFLILLTFIFLILFFYPHFKGDYVYSQTNCVEKGCHDGFLKEKNIHAPVRGRNCEKCHIGDDHPFKLAKEKNELCLICHKSIGTQKEKHPPVKDGDCTSCHNPHTSKNEKLLLKPLNDICFECHDKKPFSKKVVHPPVQDGCLTCHNAHDSVHKKLLKEAGSGLCYGCHDKKDGEKTVHPPVKDGDCLGCHNPHSQDTKGLTIESGNKLCFVCHNEKDYIGKKIIHNPVLEDCKNCHYPHSGKFARLLKSENVCVDCHGSMIDAKIVHPPVESKECLSCHTPHTSDSKKILVKQVPDICFECHNKSIFIKKVIHKPVKSECYLCHKAHSAKNQKLLVEKKDKLCEICHTDFIKNIEKANITHPPVKNKECDSCHNVHSSDFKKVLNDEPALLCNNCHNIGNVKTAKSVHNPVEEGSCGSCHTVHGGTIKKLLIKRYPEQNYVSYNPKLYELCFDCHSPDLAKNRKTVTATEFRNGDNNLHFVHVNKEKGRNCRFCHNPHMSVQSKLIVSEFKGFGIWNIPIQFSKTITGGGCVVGCHKPYYYDRLKPVKNN